MALTTPSRSIALSLGLILSLVPLSGSQGRNPRGGSPPPDTTGFPIEETTITQLHAAYLQRKATARDVTQSYINRIVAYDKRGPYLNLRVPQILTAPFPEILAALS